ncbi:MFS transporter [Kerstersia gyiorum]|uniref:MFS transporter n=1 Tax=Kerstersia gyiorum TaxID=206506 RepID=UPI0010713C70|nr:MFS transporter [Kerstersia gyiorum]QBR41821.1 MFS transporter [Kerstersia gyiorum]
MLSTLTSFSALYVATLLMLLGTGMFNTYMALRLTAQSVSEIWVGALIAAYYLGLVGGARLGHKLIIRVGHVRAYVACAAIATVMVLAQSLGDSLWLWLLFRLISGLAMVTQFMAIESWLNEQTENHQRGRVFAFYMLVSGLGTVLGQVALSAYPVLDLRPLTFVAICLSICLVPIALTARSHPAAQLPAPLDVPYFVRKVPQALAAILVSGNLTGAFYGLAPVYAAKQGMDTSQAAIFVAIAVAAGVLFQWPMGWLSDRVNRVALIRVNSILLTVIVVPMWWGSYLPTMALMILAGLAGILMFTLYSLSTAFANDHVDQERRVGLSAVLLMVYGLGACIGPLLAGVLMDKVGPSWFFVFVSACSVLLVFIMNPRRVTSMRPAGDAPVQFVATPDISHGSPLATALDPRSTPEDDVYIETVAVDNTPVTEQAGPQPQPAAEQEDGAARAEPVAAPQAEAASDASSAVSLAVSPAVSPAAGAGQAASARPECDDGEGRKGDPGPAA